MRLPIIITCLILSLTACNKHSILSLTGNNRGKLIAIQPLGLYDVKQLETISNQLSLFFNVRVITLQPLDLPEAFYSSNNNKYLADSILWLLTKIKNDSMVEIIGITHKEIYTFEKTKGNQNSRHPSLGKPIGIYGLGYISGNTCVVSDFKLRSNDEVLLNKLIRKAIIHEVGHNLGLTHCLDAACIMSKADGDVGNLIKLGDDYCKKCRQRLK